MRERVGNSGTSMRVIIATKHNNRHHHPPQHSREQVRAPQSNKHEGRTGGRRAPPPPPQSRPGARPPPDPLVSRNWSSCLIPSCKPRRPPARARGLALRRRSSPGSGGDAGGGRVPARLVLREGREALTAAFLVLTEGAAPHPVGRSSFTTGNALACNAARAAADGRAASASARRRQGRLRPSPWPPEALRRQAGKH